MAQDQQSKLESVFSYSFPANHILQFSIVRQHSDQSYKKEYFCFITLAPGSQNQQGGRTFDFKTNKITMKVEGYQITELAHAIRTFARGQEQILGPHSIFVDSGKSQYGQGGRKSLGIQRTQNQKQNNAPLVTLFFKMGDQGQALAYSMSPYRALSMADKLEFIGKKCDELEFSRGPVTAQTGAYENPNPSSFGNAPGGPAPFGANAGAENVANNFSNTFNSFPPSMDDDVPF